MNEIIQLHDKQFKKYISEEEIDQNITQIATQINEEYKDDIPIFIIILNGAIVFAVDLLKKLTIQCAISCIKLSSYQGVNCTHQIKSLIGFNEEFKGRRVIIVDDIVDTGNTYEYLYNLLQDKEVKDVRIAAMTFKKDAYTKELPVHYVGLTIPTKFIVGRGLDYNGLGRNLNDLYQLV